MKRGGKIIRALLVTLGLLLVGQWLSAPSNEDSLASHAAARNLQGYSTSTSFPEKYDSIDGWIPYIIYVSIVGGILIICGVAISIAMCIGFCCRRFCLSFGGQGSRKCWIILYSVMFGVMCLLCILVIAFTLVVATGMRTTQRAYTTAGTTGVDGLFTNIRQELAPLGPELINIMNNTLTEITQNSFDPVWDTIRYANDRLADINGVLGSADSVLNETHDVFQELRKVFTELKQYQDQGYISGVPDSSSVPDVSGSSTTALADARSQISELNQQIANLTNDLESTIASINMNSPEMASVNNLIRDTTTSILDTVDSTEASYNETNWVQKVNEYWWKYGGLFNAIRIPIMIVLSLIPIVLFALWYLGPFTGRHKCMLIGFWYAAGICWLFMILGVVHIILFIPVKDLCRDRNNQITIVVDQFVFNSDPDYAGKFGVTSPPEAVNAVNTAVGLFMANPGVVLDCKGEETLVQNLGLDLPTIFDLQNRYNSATQQVRDAVNQINIASQVESTQPSFHQMNSTVRDVSANLTDYNSTLANYSSQRTAVVGNYDPQNFWNATTEAESQNQLDAINARTSVEPTNPRVYTYDDVHQFDPNDPLQNPSFTPTDRSEYSGRRDTVVNLIQVNATVKNVTLQVNQWGVFEQNLSRVLRRADGILVNTSSIIHDAWDRVNSTLSLPQTVTDSILGYLDPAVAQAIQLARLQNLGKCAFIGVFTENGLDRGLCVEIGRAAGGVGICVVLVCFLWLFMWPILLSSKAHFAGFVKDTHDSDFFEVEMSNAK